MPVRFNEENQDMEYLQRITKQKHGESRRELLEELSPVAVQKVRNNDEGWTRLLEYLMVEEHDVAIPDIPEQPIRLANIRPALTSAATEVTDSGDITISEYEPGEEPTANIEESSSTGSPESWNGTSHHSQFGSKGELSHGSRASDALVGASGSSSAIPVKEVDGDKIMAVPTELPEVTSSHHEDEQSSVESEHNISERSRSREFSSNKEASEGGTESSSEENQSGTASGRRSERSEQENSEDEDSETRTISEQSETVVDRIRRHFVELTDWSDYLRFRSSRSRAGCCYRGCVLFLLLLILLGVCFAIYIGVMCCYGSFVALLNGMPTKPCVKTHDSSVAVSQYDDSDLLRQLSDHEQLLEQLQNQVLRQKSEISEIAQTNLESIAGNLSQLSQELEAVVVRVHELENAPDRLRSPEYVESQKELHKKYEELKELIHQAMNAQHTTDAEASLLAKQLKDVHSLNQELLEKVENLPVNSEDDIQKIVDSYAMLNADVGSYVDSKKPLGYRSIRRQRQLTLQREYSPGNCYATNEVGYFNLRLRYPAYPHFLVVGHPFAETLVHGRASAPSKINVSVKVRTPEGHSVKKLNEIPFDVNGKKEQAFDLHEFGLAEDDVVLEMQIEYVGDDSYVCVYFMGVYGHYLPIREKDIPVVKGK